MSGQGDCQICPHMPVALLRGVLLLATPVIVALALIAVRDVSGGLSEDG